MTVIGLSLLKIGQQLLHLRQPSRLDQLTASDDLNRQWLNVRAWTQPLHINAVGGRERREREGGRERRERGEEEREEGERGRRKREGERRRKHKQNYKHYIRRVL